MSIVTPANCQEYIKVTHTCSTCGDSYVTGPDGFISDWSDSKPDGVDESFIDSTVLYRYSDYVTIESFAPSLDGYTLSSSTWMPENTVTINYVKNWPSGFQTTNSLYSQYNNQSKKVTASETATTKTTINSDAQVGYLWYHWCDGGAYSGSTPSSSYPTFHAF